MTDTKETELSELLKRARTMMVGLSGQCAGEEKRDWDKAKALLEAARQIDGILPLLSDQRAGGVPASVDQRKLPYYYVQHDKLVKVGRSRDSSTYEHRVTREHYDLMVDRLRELADQGDAFPTRQFVKQCNVPAHEPLIVANLLGAEGLLKSFRRGTWSFTDAAGFANAVREVWDNLPRK